MVAIVLYELWGRQSDLKIQMPNLIDTFYIYSARVFLEPFLGNEIRLVMVNSARLFNFGILLGISLFLGLCVLLFRIRRTTQENYLIFGMLYGVFAALGLAVLTRQEYLLVDLYKYFGHRYFYVSQVLVVFLSLFAVLRIPRQPHWLSGLIGGVALLYFLALNLQNHRAFSIHREEAVELRRYMLELDKFDRACVPELRQWHVLDRGGWSIKVGVCKRGVKTQNPA